MALSVSWRDRLDADGRSPGLEDLRNLRSREEGAGPGEASGEGQNLHLPDARRHAHEGPPGPHVLETEQDQQAAARRSGNRFRRCVVDALARAPLRLTAGYKSVCFA